ncbi:MAG: putative 30S ribosomal subunit protein S10 [Candidatus Hodgkinia cicadicola]|nr:MAG: putative 30S ribosomal subunit protein S10 [Candidatus Hodgkinia cicadicola]
MMLWIKLKAYNKESLTKYTNRIVLAFRAAGNFSVRGPVYLPTKIVKYTVNKSPHIDKKSRDQLEVRVHNRLIIVIGAYRFVMPKLLAINLPQGVFAEMRLILANSGDVRYRSGAANLVTLPRKQ